MCAQRLAIHARSSSAARQCSREALKARLQSVHGLTRGGRAD